MFRPSSPEVAIVMVIVLLIALILISWEPQSSNQTAKVET